MPRDHWLEEWEKLATTEFVQRFPLEGYRRLAFMMLDANLVAVNPSSIYRVLKAAGLLQSLWQKKTRANLIDPAQLATFSKLGANPRLKKRLSF